MRVLFRSSVGSGSPARGATLDRSLVVDGAGDGAKAKAERASPQARAGPSGFHFLVLAGKPRLRKKERAQDRKRGVEGKSGSGRVDRGVRRIIKRQKKNELITILS